MYFLRRYYFVVVDYVLFVYVHIRLFPDLFLHIKAIKIIPHH